MKKKMHITNIALLCMILFLAASPLTASPLTAKEDPPEKERVFVIHAPIRDLDEYRKLAEQAVRLKPFGRVELNISSLAEKGFHDVPEGRNFWYEYTSYNPTPYKFFPDPKIAPDRLSEEEEAYFLPFVFNPSEEEARMENTDIHGAHREILSCKVSMPSCVTNWIIPRN